MLCRTGAGEYSAAAAMVGARFMVYSAFCLCGTGLVWFCFRVLYFYA